MKITLSWLLNHLAFEGKIDVIVDALNSLGIEVDNVTPCDFLMTGQIKSVSAIPKTKLFKCVVVGPDRQYTILTKLNVSEGLTTYFVPAGSHTPDGVLIQYREMFGEKSEGMFYTTTQEAEVCSKVDIVSNDYMLKLSLPTNRNDLKSVRGLARDVSIRIGTMKPLIYNCHSNYSSLLMRKFEMQIEDFVRTDIGVAYYGAHELEGYANSMGVNLIPLTLPPYKEIYLSHSSFYEVSGVSLSLQQIEEILHKSGFTTHITRRKSDINVYDDFGISVVAPIWRQDIENYMCVIEEILRIHGIQHDIKHYKPRNTKLVVIEKEDVLRTILTSIGYTEMYNIPFVFESLHNAPLKLINSMVEGKNILRDTLLYGLLECAKKVLSYNEIGAKLYEIGKVYPSEQNRIGILIIGHEPANILHPKQQLDLNQLYLIISMLNLYTPNNTEECFMLSGQLNVGRSTYNYHYYESDMKLRHIKNHFTNSMNKKYTNINIESNDAIEWKNVVVHLKDIEYRLTSYGYYREKYRMTITVAYDCEENLSELKFKLNAS